MSKQALTVAQMRDLKELGVDISGASAFWHDPDRHGDWELEFTESNGGKIPEPTELDDYCPAFTFRDLLDLLEECIPTEGCYPSFFKQAKDSKWKFAVFYEFKTYSTVSDELIDAVYNFLVYYFENNKQNE